MDSTTAPPFAALLRRYRLAAGLSQVQLAARAHLSVRAISTLERGVRRAPYRDTVDLLAAALGLTTAERAALAASVSRGRHPAAAPAAQPAASPSPTNLPTPATSFIGRDQEQMVVLRLLESVRLLTLTGAGGVGKTRLATHVAATRTTAAAYPDGVHLVELAPLTDPTLIPQTVAQTLGVREQPGRPLLDALTETLREKSTLLLLDNCEHLPPAVATFAETLLRACPGVRILATSREALGAIGETVWWVPSLSVPSSEFPVPGGAPSFSDLDRADAVPLFVERAGVAQPAFALTDATAPAVATICRRLDGIPLAIELAAARCHILTPEQIAARLDERLRLLTGGDGAVPRHETLRAALDWSYDLLTAPEQRLLHRLSVFAGGCAIEAAEAACVGEGVPADTLVELLTSLVEKSLLVVEYRGEAARYRPLESVRQYAAEHLAAAGEADAIHRRHSDWALALVEYASPLLSGPQQATWLERLDVEHDNLRAALGRSLATEDATTALRLATALQPLWQVRAHFDEGRNWFARALACAGDLSPALRARALGSAAGLAYWAGDPDAMDDLARQKLAICREIDDRQGIAQALVQIGGAAWERRDIIRAREAWDESLSMMRTIGDQAGVAGGLANLGSIAAVTGDHARAADLFEQGLSIHRSFENKRQIMYALRLFGGSLLELGDYPRTRACAEEGLAICEELGERWNAAGMLRLLGHVALADGELERAVALHEQSLTQHRAVGNRWSIAEGLQYLGRTLLTLDAEPRAETLLQESLTCCEELHYQSFLPGVLRSLGDAARIRGDLDRASTYLIQSLEESRALNAPREFAPTLERLAATVAARGQADHAVRLLSAAATLRETNGSPLRPHSDTPIDTLVTGVRGVLGDAAFAAAWAEGAALSPDDAIAYALAETKPPLAG